MGFAKRWASSAYTLWHTRAEARLPYLPLFRILDIQDRRVRFMARHAYDTVPHYRDVMDSLNIRPSDIRRASDLSNLPILENDQLARNPERFRSTRISRRPGVELHTAGTSGHSKYIAYDPEAALLALAHGHRQRMVCSRFVGGRFGYREMQVDREGGVSDRLRRFYDESTWVPRSLDLRRGTIDPTGSFEESIRQVNAFQPDAIGGVGSYIGALYLSLIHI